MILLRAENVHSAETVDTGMVTLREARVVACFGYVFSVSGGLPGRRRFSFLKSDK